MRTIFASIANVISSVENRLFFCRTCRDLTDGQYGLQLQFLDHFWILRRSGKHCQRTLKECLSTPVVRPGKEEALRS